MNTENFKSSSAIPNFKSYAVPNTPAGTKLSDIYGHLSGALSGIQSFSGTTEVDWAVAYGAIMTLFGVANQAATVSGKSHGNA